MLKVTPIGSTQPEIIKILRVIAEFVQHTHPAPAHTSRNFAYELNRALAADLGIRTPDYFLAAVGNNF